MLLEGEKAVSGTADAQGRVDLTQIVSHPRLWSAEFPNLYALEIALADAAGHSTERLSRQIGIREVTIKDGVLLVNGTRVKLTGICRHDVSAAEGTAVGEDLWTKDLKLMKAANINAIRCSHYPYGSGFYDLCDKMGFYVLDELPYCWVAPPMAVGNYPAQDPAMAPAFEQRARETVSRDKNHPASSSGASATKTTAPTRPTSRLAADLTRQLDPTRPRLVSGCPAEKFNVEMDDTPLSDPQDDARRHQRQKTPCQVAEDVFRASQRL